MNLVVVDVKMNEGMCLVHCRGTRSDKMAVDVTLTTEDPADFNRFPVGSVLEMVINRVLGVPITGGK